MAVRADHVHIRKRGCTEPGMSGVAQFGNGSVRDRKNGLLDGDVVEWEWAEREGKKRERQLENICCNTNLPQLSTAAALAPDQTHTRTRCVSDGATTDAVKKSAGGKRVWGNQSTLCLHFTPHREVRGTKTANLSDLALHPPPSLPTLYKHP